MERLDYFPFGEGFAPGMNGRSTDYPAYNAGARPANPKDGESIKFTGKERDAETGLDYFDFRLLASQQGRFTTTDPDGFGSQIDDPQSWNRYVYARNNPLRFTDPLGLDYYEICGSDGHDCANYNQEQYDSIRKDKNFLIINGKVYARNKNGTQGQLIGSVTRHETGMDDFGDALNAGMAARADASNQIVGTFIVSSAVVGATGGAAANVLGLTSGSGLTTLGTIEVSSGAAETSSAFTILNNRVPAKTLADLTRAAQKLYPGKAGRIELHHIFPKYLGGPQSGPLAPLDASYHQVITNVFRNAWGYGQGPPAPGVAQQIMQRIYTLLPYQ